MWTSVHQTAEVVVPKPPVQTLQVVSFVPVYLGTVEMDLRVKVRQIKIHMSYQRNYSLVTY